MGIKFRCPDCQKKIHVKSYLAGKKGVCPSCGAKVSIPAEGEGAHHEADDDDVLDVHQPDDRTDAGGVHQFAPAHPKRLPDELAMAATTISKGPSPVAAMYQETALAAPMAGVPAAAIPAPMASIPMASVPQAAIPQAAIPQAAIPQAAFAAAAFPAAGADPLAGDPQANWYVRMTTGDQYGPAKPPEMEQWLTEGRIQADALIWREGWADWKRADAVFPRFGGVLTTAPPAPVMSAPAYTAPAMAAPMMAAVPAGMMAPVTAPMMAAVPKAAVPATPMAAMPVGTLVAPVAMLAPSPKAAAANDLAATLATTTTEKDEEASQDTMELLKGVGNPGGTSSKSSSGSSTHAPAYMPPAKSNTPMIILAVFGGLAVLVVVPMLVVVLMQQPGSAGGGGGGVLGSLTGSGGASDWQAFSGEPEQGFTVKFPGKPDSSKTQEQTMAGLLKGTRYTSADQKSGFSYIVAVADVPDTTAASRRADEFYQESAQSAGKIVSSPQPPPGNAVKNGEHSGREYLFQGRGQQMVARIFLAGKRRYTVGVVAAGGRKPEGASVTQFFDSFKITDAGTPDRPRPMKKE